MSAVQLLRRYEEERICPVIDGVTGVMPCPGCAASDRESHRDFLRTMLL